MKPSRCHMFAVIGVLMCALAAAAETYPTKPVRFIVPFATGGSADIVARIIGQKLNEKWGAQVIVDNRAGAGGNIAGELTATAAPDGYTVFQLNVANAIAVSLYKNLKYDPVRDFTAVTQLASTPFMLMATPALNARSMQDLITFAQSQPSKLNYASSGNGGASHLLTELLKTMAHIDLVHVPYNSSARAYGDLMAGQVQFMFAPPATMLPLIKSGKLRALGVSSRQRFALAPEVPTISESGVPGFEGSSWYGVVVPAHTPASIVAKLNADIVEILQRSEIRERMLALGVEPAGSMPREFAQFIKAEIQKWAQIVKTSGAKIE